MLSPSTFRSDKVRKMPVYARYGVGYFWSLDPTNRILEAFRLEAGKWVLLGAYAEDDKVRAEPFDAIEIDLSRLWLESFVKKTE
ncbi:MAG: Uma2 family endonuclease [Acidobacteriota bacterium]